MKDESAPGDVFTDRHVVRFPDCDPAGIVFYPRYFEMVNVTVERMFETVIGWPFSKMHHVLGVTTPTVRLEVDFFEPSYMEDRLDFELKINRLGRSSLPFTLTASCGDEARFRAQITLVCIDFHAKRAVPWPDPIRAKLGEMLADGGAAT